MAAGVGCADAQVSKPAESRFSLAVVVDEHGGLGVRHAGRTTQIFEYGTMLPLTMESGDTLTLLLNTESGRLSYLVTNRGAYNTTWLHRGPEWFNFELLSIVFR